MAKVLSLYNTFTKSQKYVEICGKIITANSEKTDFISGSLYICGPTVYSESHIGHAVTYIRSDLLRRFMRSIFNVRLHTVMNITDIDDKILEKTFAETRPGNNDGSFTTDPSMHPFNQISEKYYKSFLEDLELIRVQPADLYVKVSKHVHLITKFIRKLENSGHAYVTSSGDVCFRVKTIDSYVGRVDKRQDNSSQSPDLDPRDFVLWKAQKPNEPIWSYQSEVTGKNLLGRPGWHVQCSAIASAVFGNRLDFHFGGKDLIFPHHYNEEACCCAYHQLDTSNSLHVWVNNWLHSGHLVLKDRKMSKSLGNVVPIKKFVDNSSVNALRLLCIHSHYRSDLVFDDDLIDRLKLIDHKISAFVSFIITQLQRAQEHLPEDFCVNSCADNEIERAIHATHESIILGVCDDFHLDRGLDSILQLTKLIYSKGSENLKPRDIISTWYLIKDWCAMCGLEYGLMSISPLQNETLLKVVLDFRSEVRELALQDLKKSPEYDSTSRFIANKLLKECDSVRNQLDDLGFVIRDPKA